VGKTKVYIFDECQGLTGDAQQALLKITEEAPKNTYFIFCSTNPQKIIKALKARCRQGLINLLPLSTKELGMIIKNICDKEKIELKDTTREIAKICIMKANGIPRDAIMLFEKYYKYENIDDVKKDLEGAHLEVAEEYWPMVNALDKEDYTEFYTLFEKMPRGNYESFRIMFGNVFKKKLLKALIANSRTDKYYSIMHVFSKPVDNQLGDIELITRFGKHLG